MWSPYQPELFTRRFVLKFSTCQKKLFMGRMILNVESFWWLPQRGPLVDWLDSNINSLMCKYVTAACSLPSGLHVKLRLWSLRSSGCRFYFDGVAAVTEASLAQPATMIALLARAFGTLMSRYFLPKNGCCCQDCVLGCTACHGRVSDYVSLLLAGDQVHCLHWMKETIGAKKLSLWSIFSPKA